MSLFILVLFLINTKELPLDFENEPVNLSSTILTSMNQSINQSVKQSIKSTNNRPKKTQQNNRKENNKNLNNTLTTKSIEWLTSKVIFKLIV
jgi:hypothetical protein